MNRFKQTAISVKNRVARSKGPIMTAALATTTAIVIIQQSGIREHNQFLKEKGLYEEYYELQD